VAAGGRDFNVWDICQGCIEQHPIALLATYAGPIFTFAMIWTGVCFLKEENTNQQKSLGFALIFANNPFARIFTAAMGKGDEVSGLNRTLHNHSLSWALGMLIVLLLTIYPLYKAFKTIVNKNSIGYFILFLLSAMILDLIFVFGLLNNLLKKGVLSNDWILGSPVFITLFTFAVSGIFIFSGKHIYKLAK